MLIYNDYLIKINYQFVSFIEIFHRFSVECLIFPLLPIF